MEKVNEYPLAAIIKLNPITFVFIRPGGGAKSCRLISLRWNSLFCLGVETVGCVLFACNAFLKQCELLNSCASNHFGLRLETWEIQFVMAYCAVLLAHPETRMATLVSAVSWLRVDFTHRSLTITEGFFLPGKCCKYSPDSILLVPLSLHCQSRLQILV